jgi:hypothetical protein
MMARLNADIPDDVLRQAKAKCALNGLRLQAVVTDLLADWVMPVPVKPAPPRSSGTGSAQLDSGRREETLGPLIE